MLRLTTTGPSPDAVSGPLGVADALAAGPDEELTPEPAAVDPLDPAAGGLDDDPADALLDDPAGALPDDDGRLMQPAVVSTVVAAMMIMNMRRARSRERTPRGCFTSRL